MDYQEVFKCFKPAEFLNLVLKDRQKKRPKYSLSKLAAFLKFPDAGSLSRVLNGHRAISMERAVAISELLELSYGQSMYFYQLVALQDVSDEVRIPLLQTLRLHYQSEQSTMTQISENQAELLRDYRFLSVRECLRLKNSENIENNFSKMWKASSDAPPLMEILASLEKAELVKYHNGRWLPHNSFALKSDPGTASEAVRSYHAGWLNVARDAVYGVDFANRSLQGTTLAIPNWAYAELVEQLRALHQNLLKLSVAEGADKIVHVGSFVIPVGETHEI